MQLTPRFSSGAEALDAFCDFSSQAKMRFHAHPEWKEWLTLPEISGSKPYPRGVGKWQQDLLDLGAPSEAESKGDQERVVHALRCLKQREILRIGVLDFAGLFSLEQTVEALSRLADFCLQTVLKADYQLLAKQWGTPETDFSVLGMGKLGGQELNFSSDIDVLFIYGEEGKMARHRTHHEFFTLLGQRIVKAFSCTTAGGRLFRIDLRLRPEGDSGPLARSLTSCEVYYAAHGEMWERMAWIKARSCAGSLDLGYALGQFRNSFCFSTAHSRELLEEVAAIKERINREIVGQARMEHHVKLGRGGIREIEFIVQALQLLHARRLPYLDHHGTLRTLEALATCDVLPPETTRMLAQAYRFLRTVEHRLQMRDDLQTHTLPQDVSLREAIALSLGMEVGAFEKHLRGLRDQVHDVFREIFASRKSKESFQFNFSCFRDQKAAQRNLAALNPGAKAQSHASTRTRQSYQRFAPILEQQLACCFDPDGTLVKFIRFAEAYGARGLFYETMVSNPKALELLLTLFDRSTFFSEMLIRTPGVFEDAARAGTLDQTKTSEIFLDQLHDWHRQSSEEAEVVARLFCREELTRIFIRDSLKLASRSDLELEYSGLAQACLQFGLEVLQGETSLAVIALGKWGGAELSYGSDLDCLLIGEEPELAWKLNRFMTQPLSSGFLFPMDFRMRPDGEGPLALPLEAYRDYYQERAHFWEIQAATRARWVAGDKKQGMAFMEMLEVIWQARARQPDCAQAIADMRELIETERVDPHFPEGEWKTGVGGLLDIEFALQTRLMQGGYREPSTRKGLAWLGSHCQEQEQAGVLQMQEHYSFFRRIEAVLRADTNSAVSLLPRKPEEQGKLAHCLGFRDRESFFAQYHDVQRLTRKIYKQLMPPPLH